MSITWNTGPAAMRARHNLKLKLKNKTKRKNKQAASHKLRALIKDSKKYNPSLTKTIKKIQAASNKRAPYKEHIQTVEF